jgi:hypothetical protein
MAGIQIGSSLITTLRISPAKGVRKRLLLILSKKLLTPSYAIVMDVKKVLEGLLAKQAYLYCLFKLYLKSTATVKQSQ